MFEIPKFPKARDISYKDWEHFVTLLAIKAVSEHRDNKKISLADASLIFACLDERIQQKLDALVNEEEKNHG